LYESHFLVRSQPCGGAPIKFAQSVRPYKRNNLLTNTRIFLKCHVLKLYENLSCYFSINYKLLFLCMCALRPGKIVIFATTCMGSSPGQVISLLFPPPEKRWYQDHNWIEKWDHNDNWVVTQ
jgi:hypothetical protein